MGDYPRDERSGASDDADYLWNPSASADPEIARLEQALRPLRRRPREPGKVPAEPPARRRAPTWPMAIAAGTLIAATATWGVSRLLIEPWAVTAVAGAPPLESSSGNTLLPGQGLRTDSASSAVLNVGRIGQATVGPLSRLRLVRAEGTEHRMALDVGRIQARIWAPPRFFIVETPAAVVVDLGCVYTLEVGEDGNGRLEVQSGQVELLEGSLRSLVPAGNAVEIAKGRGPGLPYPVDAPQEFRTAVAALDGMVPGSQDERALATLLAGVTARNSITLWHLLPRVDSNARSRIHDALAAAVAMPAGVTRDGIIGGDARMHARWGTALEGGWTTESVPWWKRVWRRVWTTFVTLG